MRPAHTKGCTPCVLCDELFGRTGIPVGPVGKPGGGFLDHKECDIDDLFGAKIISTYGDFVPRYGDFIQNLDDFIQNLFDEEQNYGV